MKEKIVGISICMLMVTAIIPVAGTVGVDRVVARGNVGGDDAEGMLSFWSQEHTVSIYIDRIYVFESGDSGNREPGEYFFRLYAFPSFWHLVSAEYEVDDEDPDVPYDFGKLGSFQARFTPQFIVIMAIENDKRDDLNTNEFMDWKVIRFDPPKGDYPVTNPYIEPEIRWDVPQYFQAFIRITFHY